MRTMRGWISAAAATALAGGLAGCSPGEDPITPAPASPAPSQSAIIAPEVGSSPAVATPGVEEALSYIATSKTPDIAVFDAPGGEQTTTVRSADVLTVPGATPLVFLVKERTDDWLEVYLPVRPNGSTGWVRADTVEMSQTSMRIEVSLTDFALAVYDGQEEVFSTEIGLGQDELPTPGGVYYIRELLQPPDPDGLYGPYAYGLSGYSPVLDSFAGGDAVIGIHGTNDPGSIGRAVSHGCIRLPNDAVAQLAEQVGIPLGTPVLIDDLA